MIDDLFNAFFSRGGPYCCARARAQTFGNFDPQLNPVVGLGLLQSLCIRIGHDEVDAIQRFFDHVVHCVATRATNAEYGDTWFQLGLSRHR